MVPLGLSPGYTLWPAESPARCGRRKRHAEHQLDPRLERAPGREARGHHAAHRARVASSQEEKESLRRIRFDEFELALDTPEPYERFRKHVETVRDELNALCRRLRAEGNTIHAYGASTKGNTILEFAELGKLSTGGAID